MLVIILDLQYIFLLLTHLRAFMLGPYAESSEVSYTTSLSYTTDTIHNRKFSWSKITVCNSNFQWSKITAHDRNFWRFKEKASKSKFFTVQNYGPQSYF